MKEFRFVGVGAQGRSVSGTVYAASKSAAREKVDELSSKHRFNLRDLQTRTTYRYKVRHPGGETVTGEQQAFSREEVVQALERMNMEVISVRKKLFTYQFKPATTDVVLFVRQCANLIQENLPFDEILMLLEEDISSKSLRQVVRTLHRDLKNGMEAKKAFMKHQGKLGKFTAYMLGIASRSGNMAEIFEATARFLERRDEFKKSIRSAMVTPAVTLVATIAAFIWYVWYIFPKTAGLFEDFNVDLPPMTAASLQFSHWMDANYLWVLLGITLVTLAGIAFARSARGTFLIHKYMIKIPGLGKLFHKLNIEIYCRVFAVLYSGSGDNIDVIKMAAEATGNRYISHRVKSVTIPQMMAKGVGLVPAMEASGVFTRMAISRFRSGSETGSVRKSAQQMADFYAKETDLKLDVVLQSIQTFVSIFISMAIMALTLLSAEMAKIQPSPADMMGM